MRSFGLIGLLAALLLVAWLSTRQVNSLPGAGNVREQSQQIQNQVLEQVKKAEEQARRQLPDDDAK